MQPIIKKNMASLVFFNQICFKREQTVKFDGDYFQYFGAVPNYIPHIEKAIVTL